MMPVVSGDVPEEHKQALDDMAEAGEAGSRSEAVRMAVAAGLPELGYSGSRRTQTGLRSIIRRAITGSTWALVLLVGLTWLGPVQARLAVVALLPVPAALWVVDRVLARCEPRLTRALVAALGGERA